jgi:cytosine/adenosine deaminase-related metal-dependent hydrolase
MTSESGAMPPLAIPKIEPFVRTPRRPRVVEETWAKLEGRMVERGTDQYIIEAVRAGYTSALYAASVAVLTESADYQDLTRMAAHLEG